MAKVKDALEMRSPCGGESGLLAGVTTAFRCVVRGIRSGPARLLCRPGLPGL